MIRLGTYSTVLLMAALYGLVLAALLWRSSQQRLAHRFLALLLLVIVARMVPYIIGYAGFYDAWPWLSFMPYNFSLAFGPLLYLHVVTLTRGQAPARWGWHLAPTVLQGLFYCVLFVQPLAFKNDWDTNWQRPLIGPLETWATFLSIGTYWVLSMRDYRAYQAWLADQVSDRDAHCLEWLRNFLLALGLTLVMWMGLYAFEVLISPLNYFQRFPMYVWLALLVYYLGTAGWRQAGRRTVLWVDEVPSEVAAVPVPAAASAHNWAQLGETWRARLVAENWSRDPDLTLASLARKLGTNTSHLSRAINEGLGMNFNELINRERVRAVQAELAANAPDRDLLDIALAAGFRSKASFNRAFKTYTGTTPSEWRAAQRRPG